MNKFSFIGKTTSHIVLQFAVCVLMGFTGSLVAQSSIAFDAGQTFSKFKYSDGQGAIKDFKYNINGCFGLGYQYVAPNGLFIRAGVGMRKGGASLEYNETTVEWKLQYLDVNAGIGYMLNRWRAKPYLTVSPFFAYLLKGEQFIGISKYDILANKSIAGHDFGVCFAPGLKVEVSNTFSFYTEFRQLTGLQNLETDSGTGQKSYNRGFSVHLGIAIALIRYNYVTTQ
jgi:hypothetical protein